MKKTFADTGYWVSFLDENDQWMEIASKALEKIGNSEIITTELILIEVLNYFSKYRADIKKFVAESIESLFTDETVLILEHNHEDFLKALELYKFRLDKGYSLTDCVSINVYRKLEINEILTHDHHLSRKVLRFCYKAVMISSRSRMF